MSGEGQGNRITRRAALRGAATVGAASLIRPTGAIGAPGAGEAGLFSRWIGALSGDSATIAAPHRFALVGVEWATPARATIELRTRTQSGGWSPWVVASVLGHEPDRPARQSGVFGDPIWSGPADYVQLRSAGRVDGVQLHFVAATPAPAPAHAAQALPLAQPVLDAGPGQPPIIARSGWAQGHAPPSHVPVYGTVKLAFVHHSVTPNGYSAGEVPSILLSIFDYHRYVRGYFDIAYNFAVDEFGRIWEARAGGIDLPVMGAHAGGYNTESTGMVVLGTFENVVPSPAAIGALERLLAWKLSLHGVPVLGRVTVEVAPDSAFYTPFPPGAHVSLPRVAGHRDGDLTDCPGNAFYARLPSMRPQVAQLVGSPARATITMAPSAPVNAGATVTLTGALTDLSSGAPLTGAPIEIQQIGAPHSEQTLASLTTDAGGNWTLTFTPTANVFLRALHRPAPAAVSDVVAIAVAPVVTVTVEEQAPLVVSGTVSPAVHPVTIVLYKVVRGRRHEIASKRLPATGGQFHARLKTRGPGRYVVIAQTPATARYSAATSAPLAVTL
ncbi:MAG TPA: N-acetylmuramoyl-L-alanine amidase [Solirubrobacteraceae bacterium]|nr:N-acetylmuramoyl-L-alanine amidase [Solirubrobacteraceae bacterium]